jgi:hypothetical protein
MTFWLGLTCYPNGSVHRFTACFCGKRQGNMWFQREGCGSLCTSDPRTSHSQLQRLLDWTKRPCVWAFQVTGSTPMDFFLWYHIKALIYTWQFNSEDDLIARIVKALATIKQQHAIFECARHSVASSSVSAVYRDLGPCFWTSALNWYKM